ncbi:MAG: hypothetical protein E7319_08865 [Clostridiales bacterium]|nr:hypothetical protein [Clostridiales bacterium]
MDLLKTLVLYMTMVFASSVQNTPDVEMVMAQYVTPTPTVVVATETPRPTPSPTPVPTIAISPNPEYKTLQMGDRGEQVLKLQQALSEYGYYEGEMDSAYGNQTRYAVERFQYAHGLVADGIAGKNTLTVLYDSNQVRYAQPTPTPSPEADQLTVALPQESATPAPSFEPITLGEPAQETADAEPADEVLPVEEQEETEPTEMPQEAEEEADATESAVEPATESTNVPEPSFAAMEDWCIRLDAADLLLTINSEDGMEAMPVQPYALGDLIYVPLVPALEGEGVLVLVSTESVEHIEIGFALGNHLYRLAFTENQEGEPVGLEVYCDNETAEVPVLDVRQAEGMYYLPADSVTALTGITFTVNDDEKLLTIHMPAAQEE